MTNVIESFLRTEYKYRMNHAQVREFMERAGSRLVPDVYHRTPCTTSIAIRLMTEWSSTVCNILNIKKRCAYGHTLNQLKELPYFWRSKRNTTG